MERHPNDLTTDEEIEEALEQASQTDEPRILEALYRSGPGLDFFMLRLSDGRRLLIPNEELGELSNATPEQATDLFVLPTGSGVWWPQLDDGLYLPDFLEHRWGKALSDVAA